MSRGLASITHGRRLRHCAAAVAAVVLLLTLPSSAAEQAPGRCQSEKDAVDRALASAINWIKTRNQTIDQVDYRKSLVDETEKKIAQLHCSSQPESADCKAAIAERGARVADLRAEQAKLAAAEQALQAATERGPSLAAAYRQCLAAGPTPEELPLFPPLAPSTDTQPPTTRLPPKPAVEQPKPQPPPAQPTAEQSKPQPPAPPTPPPATEAFVPRILPLGTYRALLWPGLTMAEEYRKDGYRIAHPHPVELTIDATGRIVGSSRWQLTAAETDPTTINRGQRVTHEFAFRLEGKTDWSSGAIELRMLDGRKSLHLIQEPYGSGGGYQVEFEYAFTGWQLGHPALAKPLVERMSLVRQSRPEAASDPEKTGLPRFESDTSGKLKFGDFGWAGIPDYDQTTKRPKTGPGGGARITVKKATDQNKDTTANLRGWETYPYFWYLKILGPMTVAAEAKPPPGAQKDPNGFAVWPLSPLRVRPGETFTLDAMGAYADNPYDAVKLNDRATWEMSSGVTRGAGNEFRATAPGRYRVKATIRRNDGGTMSDTVEIIVGP